MDGYEYAKNKSKDQFYTRPEIASYCVTELEKFVHLEDSFIVEPSAGNGVFLDKLPPHTLGLDLEPKHPRIMKKDFFDFCHVKIDSRPVVFVGNPPFGIRHRLSIAFFNHAARCDADYIAFIIPKAWRKRSVQIRLDRRYHVIHDVDLPQKSFDCPKVHVSCCFMIFEKREYFRDIEPRRHDVCGWKFTSKDDADIAIRKQCTQAGKIFDPKNLPALEDRFHYVKITDDDKNKVLDIFKRCENEMMSTSKNVCNRESITLGEIERIYNIYTEK